MRIKITADSTCDLSPELVERYGVGIMPLSVIMGEKIYKDGIDIKPTDIFTFVKENGILPKSSAPSVEEYAEFFDKSLKDSDIVIHINISSKASASYENATHAAEAFKKKVYTVDSYALSSGQGLLVLKACDLVNEGKKPQEIIDTLLSLRSHVNTSFVPDALDYLHKGGRCSLIALMGAKILKLHPMIDMKEGQLYAKKKYMGGIERCLKSYINDLAELYPKYDKTRCFITHSSCEREVVEKVIAQVKETFSFDEVLETTAGCVVTTHCGKNTLGLLFIHE